jgi:class 3 adenylate cyclase
MLWEHKQERARLLRAMRREREFREQWLMESTCEQLRDWFRQHVGLAAENGLQAALGADRFWEELLRHSATRQRWLKSLQKKNKVWAREARAVIRDALRFLRRGHRQWWGRLSREELTQAAQSALLRWQRWLADFRDFHQLRSTYAHTGHQGLGWLGIKLWRGTELVYTQGSGDAHDRLICTPVWSRMQLDMDNAFAEGNLFLCRSAGEIYPGAQTRRQRSAFLFADLRNSTETTMKLTKDTASYLTPYLTAVDTEAQACCGERIYFAGDGYAAHYAKAMDAIRAAYNLAGRFTQLRAQSTEEQRRKIKALYLELKTLNLPWQKPLVLEKRMLDWKPATLSSEGAILLKEIISTQVETLAEDGLMKLLLRVASEFCMPRVDVGVGLTCGELFLAMVGAEGRPKYPIVISPALTQAARLSGSSDVVKKYIEEHLPQPFPFNAYAWDKKLFNRGIVISDDVFELLKSEVHIKEVVQKEKNLEKEKFLYYYDTLLNKRLILRDIQETVALKGISKPCHLYEVILPYSLIDKLYGSSEE